MDQELQDTGEELQDQAAADPSGEIDDQAAADLTGDSVAEAPEATPPAAVEIPAGYVPLASKQDEVRKRQEAQDQLEQFRQIAMQQQATIAALQNQQPQQAQQPQDVLERIGITPDDIYTPEGVRKFATGINQLVAEQVQTETRRFRQELENQQFSNQYKDYNELVGTQGPMGFQPSDAFKRAMAEDPGLQQDLVSIQDPMAQRRMAYRAAKQAKRVMDLEAGQANPRDIAATVASRTAPMSPAAVGGGGSFTVARTVGNMSDEEFARLDREAAGR